MSENKNSIPHLDWLDPLKALALFGILLNHLVEIFGSGPWFTHPSNNWPDLATRISQIFPQDYSFFPISLVQFLGWLGDNGPGVFILLSGFGLTWAALHRPNTKLNYFSFFKRRVLRIFPLYITLHFLFIIFSAFVSDSELYFASPNTLLSLLGLRFTNSLFFYINPSWWFIWLILQLYLVYPFLMQLLNRKGWKVFLIITFSLTFLARLYGLLFSDRLYFWMMGIFFLTRLAEFTAGMLLAVWLKRLFDLKKNLPGVYTVFAVSFLVYLLGFISSILWYGTIVSNLLISFGLSGIFYAMWCGLFSKIPGISKLIIWIGVSSYAIYLIHQTPMQWTANFFEGSTHLVVAIGVMLLSLPAGWALDTLVNKAFKFLSNIKSLPFRQMVTLSVSLGGFLLLIGMEPKIPVGQPYQIFSWFSAIILSILIYIYLRFRNQTTSLEKIFLITGIIGLFLQLFIIPVHYGELSLFAGGISAVVYIILSHLLKRDWLSYASSFVIIGFLFLAGEAGLCYFTPIEVGRWGEYPALQKHPTRVYALKPNLEVRLKYNNYNYILRTNSHGLANPEITVERDSSIHKRILVIGDAFSMPEGIQYEQSYTSLLNENLNHGLNNPKIQVINAGVTGYGPVEQLPQLRELAPLFKPDIVLYQFFINEFQEVQITREDRLKNIGLIQLESFRERLIGQSQLIAHFYRTYELIKEKLTGRPGIWRYWKSLLSFYKTGANEYYSEENVHNLKIHLRDMQKICEETNSRFVIFFVPGAVEVSQRKYINYFPWDQNLSDGNAYDMDRPLKNLQNIATDVNIPVLDLTPYLKTHSSQPLYFPDSWHWNEEGHRVVATVLKEYLLNSGLIDKEVK